MVGVCFVCLGNICRSPTAEGVMRALVTNAGLSDKIRVDSAGTAAYHVGEKADARTRKTAKDRGVILAGRARQFVVDDFMRFDYVLAMDRSNLADLRAIAPNADSMGRLHLLRSFDSGSAVDADVPDPYYGGSRGFDDVFDICQAACRGLFEHLVREHQL